MASQKARKLFATPSRNLYCETITNNCLLTTGTSFSNDWKLCQGVMWIMPYLWWC